MINFNNKPKTNKFYVSQLNKIIEKTKNLNYQWLIHEDFPLSAFYADDKINSIKIVVLKVDMYHYYMSIKNQQTNNFLTINAAANAAGQVKLYQKIQQLYRTIIHSVKEDAYDSIINKLGGTKYE